MGVDQDHYTLSKERVNHSFLLTLKIMSQLQVLHVIQD